MLKSSSLLRAFLHVLLLWPLLWLVYRVIAGDIGTDPAESIVRYLGFTGACMLWACLAITPLRLISGNPSWVSYRRALGLWAFFYTSLHLAAFLIVWAGLDLDIIIEEITKRLYVYIGLAAWLLLLPLAVTSTKASRRKLGRRWVVLHKLIYPSAVLAVVHMLWLAKLDYLQPALFAVMLFLLLLMRRNPKRN
ncbi:protein-methionine-sulfoxide reductase heme-binding subunit MsrQ [Ketobacter alkanivorans]|uniref:Protein-methionine-sulfoxide reductase heme-binding subunit MsrQ n=1 Tax=Ketobacter alkanivorans TaxID=1917421 RepID=A0A2K9LHT8_9GAMM|nr:ferric reductase-like transmembrane domain-containing protein [Ketobacter alkanivorans]AUM11936.1 hypothetical protein Kalk_05650 [Ketobacter alkanivorans]